MHYFLRFIVSTFISVWAPWSAAQANDFYKGKTVTIITSTGTGGSYDALARTVARHMPRHLSGQPTMIVQNMPGGGHTRATNHLYNVAPRDGTTIGTVNQSIPAHQVLDGRGVRYDAAKFHWLGAFGDRNQVLAVWHTTGIESFDDLRKTSVTAGATGEGSSAFRYPTAMNNVLGTNIKIVKGYKSGANVELALAQGEVTAHAHAYSAYRSKHPDWIRDGKIRFILQIGAKRDPELKDVPLWTEVARTEEERRILKLIGAALPLGRPYLAPPGLSLERVTQLRDAFSATLADNAFRADAGKQRLEVIPITGKEVESIVEETINSAPQIVQKAQAAMRSKAKK